MSQTSWLPPFDTHRGDAEHGYRRLATEDAGSVTPPLVDSPASLHRPADGVRARTTRIASSEETSPPRHETWCGATATRSRLATGVALPSADHLLPGAIRPAAGSEGLQRGVIERSQATVAEAL